jgi:hypothetical protein
MYTVALLIEQELSRVDADEVVGLRDQTAETTNYWVVLPVDEAAHRVETSLGAMAANEPFGGAPVLMPDVDLEEIRREVIEESHAALAQSIDILRAAGAANVDGEVTNIDPVDAVTRAVAAHSADEVVVFTRPHLVAEFFHVDWTSRARKRLGVPLLHLIEHKRDRRDRGVRGRAGNDPPSSSAPPTAAGEEPQ